LLELVKSESNIGERNHKKRLKRKRKRRRQEGWGQRKKNYLKGREGGGLGHDFNHEKDIKRFRKMGGGGTQGEEVVEG